jgi:hypothetical protein
MSSLLETCVATHGAEFSINLLGCINDGTEAVSVGGAIYRSPSAIPGHDGATLWAYRLLFMNN